MKRNYLILPVFLSVFLMFSGIHAQASGSRNNSSYSVNELVEAADYRGVWYKSKIVGIDQDKYKIHFFGFDAAWDEWVTTDKIRYSDDDEFGTEVEVEQRGVWYKAFLIDSRYGTERLVSYDGYDEEEWVKNERVRQIGEGWRNGRGGRMVEVAYGKKWLRATILKRRYTEVYVHYEGYEDVWNEWVKTDKIRPLR